MAYSYTANSRPNFVAPIYLQYDWTLKKDVPADARRCSFLAATDDPLGLAPHSIKLYNDWTAAKKIRRATFVFDGGHAFGMQKQTCLPTRG